MEARPPIVSLMERRRGDERGIEEEEDERVEKTGAGRDVSGERKGAAMEEEEERKGKSVSEQSGARLLLA